MLPQKIEHWLKKKYLPQRLLLSGTHRGLEVAYEIVEKFCGIPLREIQSQLNPDILLLLDTGDSFKIGDEENPEKMSSRGLVQWINQKPVASHRIVILENFERATNDAVSALLKTLEEPPVRAIFVFTTQNHHQMLETICSRMTVVPLAFDEDEFDFSPEIKQFLEGWDLIEKFQKINQLCESVKEESDTLVPKNFVKQLLLHARYFPQYQPQMELIFESQQALQKNVNVRLVLERLAIKLTNFR